MTQTGFTFMEYALILAAVIVLVFFLPGNGSANEQPLINNTPDENGSSNYFSKIYIDGFNANSNGFKLLLRTYERRMDTYFKPFLVDIDFILMDEGKIIYKDTQEQVSLLSERQGTTEIINQAHIALEEGKNYTALAKIYLHDEGVPIYYVNATSFFTARNDAIITEVYGDSVGASATIKSKSMVPLNATIIFTLTRNGSIIEKKELLAPSIMSHDKEKTVNILWDMNPENGLYMVSAALSGNGLIVNYDKIFMVEKKIITTTAKPEETSRKTAPGFTLNLIASAIISLFVKRSLKRGSKY